ncbi:alpha/beta hydrolase [Halalkalibacter nanhaiisediminis]|uniref:Peptidase S9 prolyl oligopeptidase catalytic domain-containing protein n=1 Tax=Halalkalibacter nanhaiisediminis TaxID=688079 RepID=A0A562QML1_9BACI|nr:alpha/beta hydrolase [Halalkalibacter nanhaiisediminis]TWI57992.1 hypothetical protein IQ10_01323 [Halalkalibacter nanhaiisediminis]
MNTTPSAVRFYSNRLSGVVHYPENHDQKHPAIIFVHGFVGSKVGDHRLFVKAANYFTKLNYVSFRFDFKGCGESDGDYQDVTLTEQIKELQAAIEYVSQLDEVDPEQIILIGHSLGGAVTALTSSLEKQIKHIVLWSPVARPYQEISAITGAKAVETAKQEGVYDHKGFLLSHTFFTDLKAHQPLEAISSYSGTALIIHAEKDEAVPKENAATYKNAITASYKDQLVDVAYVNGADHTFSATHWEQELFASTSEWLKRALAHIPEKVS